MGCSNCNNSFYLFCILQHPITLFFFLFELVRNHKCILFLVNAKLPFSMDPEYQAAQRAYMRYHNMDPIFGISSK
jgi:hypothetical protein